MLLRVSKENEVNQKDNLSTKNHGETLIIFYLLHIKFKSKVLSPRARTPARTVGLRQRCSKNMGHWLLCRLELTDNRKNNEGNLMQIFISLNPQGANDRPGSQKSAAMRANQRS